MSKFLDDMLDDPYDNESSSTDIAKVKFSFVWQVGVFEDKKKDWTNTIKYFAFISDEKRAAMYKAKSDSRQYTESEKISGFPRLGILLDIPLDTFLTAHENLNFHIKQFTNSWHSSKKQMGEGGNLDEAQQELVKGLMPYDVVVESLRPLKEYFNEFVWVRMGQTVNWYNEGISYRKNPSYASKFYVVKEVFENEEAARAAYDADNKSDDMSNPVNSDVDSELSQFALDNKWTLETLKAASESIISAVEKARKGEGTPDSEPLSQYNAELTVAVDFNIDVEDLKILLPPSADENETHIAQEEIPF